tara:strand:- start:1228 stop:1728 length:501 start_codon:yes stop_codon:yes gene_type:complete
MTSCPRNDKLAAALKTPEVVKLRNKLDELMKQVPCSRDGHSMSGGAPDVATMAKIGTVCLAIVVALQSVVDVTSAMYAQCSSVQLTTNLMAGSSYCSAQQALLATTVAHAVTKVAAASGAAYTFATSTGGKKRTRRRKSGRRKSGRRKSGRKKTNKKRKRRTRRRR